MTIVVFAAIVSIGRIDRPMRLYTRVISSKDHGRTGSLTVRSLVSVHKKHYRPRVVFLDGSPWTLVSKADESPSNVHHADPTQLRFRPAEAKGVNKMESGDEGIEMDMTTLYDRGDSNDFPDMERRLWPGHEFDPDCEPMARWQSEFHPVCNDIHAVADLKSSLVNGDVSLLSNRGFWRHAWRHQAGGVNATLRDDPPATTVWKTFKYVWSGNFGCLVLQTVSTDDVLTGPTLYARLYCIAPFLYTTESITTSRRSTTKTIESTPLPWNA